MASLEQKLEKLENELEGARDRMQLLRDERARVMNAVGEAEAALEDSKAKLDVVEEEKKAASDSLGNTQEYRDRLRVILRGLVDRPLSHAMELMDRGGRAADVSDVAMHMAAMFFRERLMEATDNAERYRADHQNLMSVYEKSPADMDSLEIAAATERLYARLMALKAVEMKAAIEGGAAVSPTPNFNRQTTV